MGLLKKVNGQELMYIGLGGLIVFTGIITVIGLIISSFWSSVQIKLGTPWMMIFVLIGLLIALSAYRKGFNFSKSELFIVLIFMVLLTLLIINFQSLFPSLFSMVDFNSVFSRELIARDNAQIGSLIQSIIS